MQQKHGDFLVPSGGFIACALMILSRICLNTFACMLVHSTPNLIIPTKMELRKWRLMMRIRFTKTELFPICITPLKMTLLLFLRPLKNIMPSLKFCGTWNIISYFIYNNGIYSSLFLFFKYNKTWQKLQKQQCKRQRNNNH